MSLKGAALAEKPFLYLLLGLFCDATVWAEIVTDLDDLVEIQTPDFLGQDSILGMARSVLETAPERFAVVGHSMGARVALEIIRLAPERVERLALLDTGTHAQRDGEAATRQVLVDLAANEGMQALAARWLPPMVHPDTPPEGPLMASLRAMVGRATQEIFAGQVKALLNRPDAERGLSSIRCLVLIGLGRQDAWSPPSQHEAMAAAIPHAEYVMFENSGHMAPMKVPDAVIAALRGNAGDIKALLALLADLVAHDINQGPREVGRAAFRTFLERMNRCYRETLSDIAVMTDPSGTRAAAEFIVHGTYLQADDGIAGSVWSNLPTAGQRILRDRRRANHPRVQFLQLAGLDRTGFRMRHSVTAGHPAELERMLAP